MSEVILIPLILNPTKRIPFAPAFRKKRIHLGTPKLTPSAFSFFLREDSSSLEGRVLSSLLESLEWLIVGDKSLPVGLV